MKCLYRGIASAAPKCEWNDNTGSGNGDRETHIATNNRRVDLEPNKEEEETQPNVGKKRKKGY
jgi:hypothetical protein